MKLGRYLRFALIGLTLPIAGHSIAAQVPQAPPGIPAAEAAAPASWEGFLQDRNFDQFITIDLGTAALSGTGTLQILGQVIPVSDIAWSGNTVTARVGGPADNLSIVARRDGSWLSGELREGTSGRGFALREIPAYPAPRNRVEAWSQDLDALSQRFANLDRSLSPAERTLFVETIDRIRGNLGNLSDAQVTMQIASAIALSDEPHTRLLLVRNATELRRLPIRVWWFLDGLYVIRTTPEYQSLLGCRIEDFAHVPARHARDIAGRAFAGNSSWRDYLTTYTLTSPEALHGLGISPQLEEVEIGVGECRGAGRRTIRPLPLARSDRTVESWWDLSPLRESPHGITAHVLGDGSRRLPLYLRNPSANYSYEYLADSDVLYFQFSRSDNSREETVSAFGERLLAALERRRPRALVIDVRFNTGGNASLARELFQQLNERTAGIPRYLITGRTTFSAGISAMAQILSGGPATIVGEQPGDDLDHWSEGGYVRLPNSSIEVDFQTVLHSYSPPPCPRDISCVDMNVASIDPNLPVTATWRDYAAGRDPALEAVLSDVARRR